jgi:hypothetical protein
VSKLVLIGGPPAVGKTTLLEYLPRHFDSCACLDADDVWRIQPVDYLHLSPTMKTLWFRNVTSVLRNYLDAGASYVFLTWVLANPLLVEQVLEPLRDACDANMLLFLVATPEALEARCRREPDRGRLVGYGLTKLRQIEALPHPRIDTTNLDSPAVAERVAALVKDALD